MSKPTQHKTFRLTPETVAKLEAIAKTLGPRASLADALHEAVAKYKLK